MEDTFDLINKLYDEKKYDQALPIVKKLAEQGNAVAQFVLGDMYMRNHGIPQDYKEAVKWFTLSANQGNPHAQCNLAGMYYNGWGVPLDYKESVKWYRLASDQGDYDAQYNLAICYKNGYGVDVDLNEALKLYIRSLVGVDDKANAMTEINKLMTHEALIHILISKTQLEEQVSQLKDKVKSDKARITQLEEQVDQLKTELEYQPGGIGYTQVKEHFESISQSVS